MNDLEARVARLEERLDRQAAAIRELRKRLAAREHPSMAALRDGATAVAPPDGWSTAWSPGARCHMCGGDKEPHRDAMLTCKACGKRRQQMIQRVIDPEPVSECTSCGAAKPRDMRMLCGDCRTKHTAYRTRK